MLDERKRSVASVAGTTPNKPTGAVIPQIVFDRPYPIFLAIQDGFVAFGNAGFVANRFWQPQLVVRHTTNFCFKIKAAFTAIANRDWDSKKQLFRHGDADRHVVFFLLLPGPALLNEDAVLPEQREGMNYGVFLGGVALLPLLAEGRLEYIA